ncbi:unconventional myosin-XVI isoform X2 [Pangasianodon hypophthalmus]|uniref:unconventional myosin-XVI isoform X2 n=1 Tax=Pangasianodon hypophthalmus TaxID=310915 RepID=UPI002306DFEB|nr:unconventional myosin-XVI isoform X2 [Pangasianodon hypophthalmus]
MSHYRFIKCCCFQLCNAFRQNMEIDQCLLESLPLGQRQRLVRRMRCDQLRAYYERERTLQKQSTHKPHSSQRKKHSISFSLSDILQDAIIRHDDKEVLKLLKEGADLNTVLSSGGSLLHLCARHDNVFAAEILIERGLNINLQDEDLWTALHVACACDHTDIMLLLLLSGVNALLQDVNGNVPLDYAAEGSETSYILTKHLEECGVDLSSIHQMKTQRASVMLSDVRQLVSSGASVNQRNEDGVTLLHIACASGYRDVVYLLLESGADVLATDNNYWTPLHLAAKYGQMHIVNQLLKHKADPTLLNYNQDKPSDIAASDQIADMLLKAEEFWVQRQKDPTLLLPHSEEHCEDLNQDVSMLVKKLTPMTMPISKRDSLLEKDIMFRDSGGALTRQSSQDNGPDGAYPSTTSKLEQVKLMPPAPNDDLASLSELTDSSLLYEMQKRFGNNQIYTYIGHILLLINPNKDLPIYSNLVSQLYLSSSGRLCSSLPPHIFSSAERAFHMMLQERRPQCFIISGESGSGKSEACKHILKHLAARSCPKGFALEPRMKHVNAILEAFGHAKTPMNTNSSRFIKLLSLQYSEKRRTLLRARVYTYMLEKARFVCTHQNFNIFYLMAEGLSAEEKSNLNLDNIIAHRYLSSVTPAEAAAVNMEQSREKLAELKHALRALGFNKSEVENLFVVLSALLHLGELRFTALTDADTSLVSDQQLLDRVAGMLQVSPEDLGAALTSDVQYFKGDVITRRHTVEMSNQYRDLLTKALYGRLFSVLVNSINSYLQGQDESLGDPSLEISILDVFGFEKFQKNNFEQLCVNMVNERIQQYTTELLFQQEQQECLQEGVAMETVRSPASQPALVDFFYQPQGMLCVLDEESQSLRPSELNLYKRLQAQLDSTATDAVFLNTKDGNGNPPPKDQGPSFTVAHYAGKMSYDLTGSLEKNRDALPQNILFVLKSSENVLIHQMFQCKLTQTGSLVPPNQRLQLRRSKGALLLHMPSSASTPRDAQKYLELKKLMKKKGATSFIQRLERCGPVTVALQLRNSLSEISSKLQLCTPHFVHCVRPNSSGQADTFDSSLVSTQLQYVGVLEMVRMIRYGYPVRMPFTGFLTRYRELVDTTVTQGRKMSAEEKCRHVLQHCKLQGWQLGSSKVFLRYWQADHLNDRCHQLHKKIVTCQKVARGWLVRHRVRGKLSYQQREQCNVQRFLQGAEDLGLRAYDSLVIQNAADIARENDRLRGHVITPPLGERPEPVGTEDDSPRRPVEKSGRVNDAVGRAGSRPIRHFRSSSVPIPLVIDNLVHSGIGPSIKPAFQSVTHSSEEGGSGGLSSPRKQPPPKPKRDPNTRLSASYEAVSAGLSIAPKDSPAEGQVSPSGSPPNTQLSPSDPLSKPRPHSDDYSTMKKIPPPKPKRSPNTKLTGSYEEISSAPAPVRPTDMKLACLARSGHFMGLVQRAASDDGPHLATLSVQPVRDDEDVYIEMVSTCRAMSMANSHSPEQNEAVYEEMKYYPHDEGGTVPQVAKPEVADSAPFSCTITKLPQNLETKRPICLIEHPNMLIGRQQSWDGDKRGEKSKKDGTACDIPAPFPNLLPHRPPLLVFPPSPVTCSPASDESPLTPLEVKKLPVFETNLNYSSQDGGSPLSPQYCRQRADSSPSLSVLIPDKSTPPLTPPPPAAPPPPYRPPSHFPFPPEANFLVLSRTSADSKMTHKGGHSLAETPPGSAKPPYSPVKSSRPEPRRAHSCSSSPLLFNPANGRALTSPLDELNTLFSSGRSLLRKSTTGRKIRDSGFSNSNMNLPGREEQGPSSPQLQDKNANHRTSSPNSPIPAPMENGNQISNGTLEDDGHHKTIASSASTLHRHMDSHHTQVIRRFCVWGDQGSTFQDLLRWRRSVCDGRTDWQNAWLQPQGSPTLLRKHKSNTTKKASP